MSSNAQWTITYNSTYFTNSTSTYGTSNYIVTYNTQGYPQATWTDEVFSYKPPIFPITDDEAILEEDT